MLMLFVVWFGSPRLLIPQWMTRSPQCTWCCMVLAAPDYWYLNEWPGHHNVHDVWFWQPQTTDILMNVQVTTMYMMLFVLAAPDYWYLSEWPGHLNVHDIVWLGSLRLLIPQWMTRSLQCWCCLAWQPQTTDTSMNDQVASMYMMLFGLAAPDYWYLNEWPGHLSVHDVVWLCCSRLLQNHH